MTDGKDWHPLDSSVIDAAAFDSEGLHVRMKHGGIYTHQDATRDDFDKLKAADSPGSHWNKHLRQRGR